MLQHLRCLLAGRAFGAVVLGLLMLRSTVAGACAVQDLCAAGDHGHAVVAPLAAGAAPGLDQGHSMVGMDDAAWPAAALADLATLAAPAGAPGLEAACHCDCGHTPTALPTAMTLPSPPADAAVAIVRHEPGFPAGAARALRPPIA